MKKPDHEFAILTKEPPGYCASEMFFFFDDFSELEEPLTMLYGAFAVIEDEAVAKAFHERLHAFMETTNQDFSKGGKEIVLALMNNCCGILYAGKLSDLAVSMDKEAIRLRGIFRKVGEEDDEAKKPIANNETENFWEFIYEYVY